MGDEVILVAYSEIGLKSPPVRRWLEGRLMAHLRKRLENEGLEGGEVSRSQGRLIVEGVDCPRGGRALARVFGVASVMPSIRIRDELKTIVDTVSGVAEAVLKPGQSFAIRARRTGKQSYSSKDIEVASGDAVLETLQDIGVRVNLTDPDVTFFVEARGEKAYVYHLLFQGLRGLPFGTQGRVVSLFSGGIDSPVASWMMMRRGCHVTLLFFDQRPFVGDDYYHRALRVAGRIREFVPLDNYSMSVIPLGEIMREIVERAPSRLICLCCKRMMYRIGSMLAEERGAEGLVSGESLGQVASQTLYNLRVLDEASSLPVFRPLIGFEKLESVEWAKKIGTYELSITPVHGCTALPGKPSARARVMDVKRVEEGLEVQELVSGALEEVDEIPL